MFTTFDICSEHDTVTISDSNGKLLLKVKGNPTGTLPATTITNTNRASVFLHSSVRMPMTAVQSSMHQQSAVAGATSGQDADSLPDRRQDYFRY
jgi:hypothetical protein